jgi:FkbM family methyltransferase
MIAFMYLQKKKDGFYLDIGANDGISGSNTYIFEQIGWKGVCIEPQPDVFKKLKKYRKCDCYNVAISSKTEDSVNFFKAYYVANQLSGIDEGISESNRQWAKEFGKTEIIQVKTMTFDEIMTNYQNVKHIDFMSLDVEGYEVPILETIKFHQYSFGFITIEKNNPPTNKRINENNGYRFYMETVSDSIFAPECVEDRI